MRIQRRGRRTSATGKDYAAAVLQRDASGALLKDSVRARRGTDALVEWKDGLWPFSTA
jgi:hypothetical protein